MTRHRSIASTTLLLAGLATAALSLPARAATNAVPGEILVKYRGGLSAARRARTAAVLPEQRLIRGFTFIGVEHLRLEGISAEQAIARLEADPDVEYAEPNYVITADMIPNDTYFSQLWNMHNTGQGGGYAGDDIHATQAWDLYTGDPNMKVGVLDTGIDYTHPDLAANLWTNPGEIAGNGVDDDHNGYVDDVHGYDVLNHDGDPMDDGSHGTHVAGTIAAVGNNATGVTGVLWHCKLVAIKFMNATGIGSEADAVAGLEYGLAVGVRVTNNSWGNMPGGQALLDAINACGAAGQLFICAAGNNGWNIDMVPVYPPSFLAPGMITVAATDGRDLRPTFSNYGAVTVNLGAPGYNIYSCKPGNLYQSLNGTSMSAPHVTGVAALAMGMFPNATSARIRQLILDSVDPIASMAGITTTGGRLNAYKTLVNGDAIAPSRILDLAIADTGSTSVGLAWTAPGDDTTFGQATRYELRRSTGPIDATNFASATAINVAAPLVAGSPEAFQVTGLPFVTTQYVAIRAIDDFGNPGPISNVPHAATLGIPTVALAPASIALFALPGAVFDTTVAVSNVGLGRLDFALPAPNPTAWLAASPATGRVAAGTSTSLVLHVNTTGLAEGAYGADLTITSNDPVTGVAHVPVAVTVTSLLSVGDGPASRYGLRIASANPGTRRVALELSLPEAGPVEVGVFDLGGRRLARLAHGTLPAGAHALRWDGVDARGRASPPGIYFARAWTRGGTFERRMVVLE